MINDLKSINHFLHVSQTKNGVIFDPNKDNWKIMNKNIHKKRNKQWKKDSVNVFVKTEIAPAGQVKWLFYCPHWLT